MRKNDPPAPADADFRAVNSAPAAVWVSTPTAGELSAIADPTSVTSADPGSVTSSATEDRSTTARALVLCMRRFAGQAYDTAGASIQEDCGLKPTPWNSTDVMKVWDSKVAFAGRSTPDPSPRCADVTGDGKYSGRSIGYCTQINAPALSTLSPLENHHLASWDDQIRTLGDAELIDGMFKVN